MGGVDLRLRALEQAGPIDRRSFKEIICSLFFAFPRGLRPCHHSDTQPSRGSQQCRPDLFGHKCSSTVFVMVPPLWRRFFPRYAHQPVPVRHPGTSASPYASQNPCLSLTTVVPRWRSGDTQPSHRTARQTERCVTVAAVAHGRPQQLTPGGIHPCDQPPAPPHSPPSRKRTGSPGARTDATRGGASAISATEGASPRA